MNSWDLMECTQSIRTNCPAYPNNGKQCWELTGTKCQAGHLELATHEQKMIFCRQCKAYKPTQTDSE